jgi:hypothetical protein
VLGPNHPDTVKSHSDLARLLKDRDLAAARSRADTEVHDAMRTPGEDDAPAVRLVGTDIIVRKARTFGCIVERGAGSKH